MIKFLFLIALSIACFAGEPKFDWTTVVEMPNGIDPTKGNQILHFKAANKPYWESETGRSFVEKYLGKAIELTSDAEALKFGSDHVKIKGLYVELGVCVGKTINFIAALNPNQTVYGFDSFEGLPEDWLKGDKVVPAKTFAFKNPKMMPPVLHNVELIKGLFSDTLPQFVNEHREPIALLHIDCDLYSSTATAFDIFGEQIVPGTIIVFDELYNYPSYEQHEFKALQEFLIKKNLQARYLAYNVFHEQVVVEIISPSKQDVESVSAKDFEKES